MDKFFQDITSLYWWIGIFLVGIMINIIANYLPKIIFKVFGNFSKLVRDKNENYKQDRESRIQRLVDNPERLSQRYLYDNIILFRGSIGFGSSSLNRGS